MRRGGIIAALCGLAIASPTSASAYEPPDVQLLFSDGFVDGGKLLLGHGFAASLTVSYFCGGAPNCPPNVEIWWSCDGEPPRQGPTRYFDNYYHLDPKDDRYCVDTPSTCEAQLVPIPGGVHPPVTVSFSFVYEGSSGKLAKSQTFLEWIDGLQDEETIPAFEGGAPGTGEILFQATNSCGFSTEIEWQCMGPTLPNEGETFAGDLATFVHPGLVCTPSPTICLVTARSTDGRQGFKEWETRFEMTTVPTTVTFEPALTNPVTVRDGQGVSVVHAHARNDCADDYEWTWNCTGPDQPKVTKFLADSDASFNHPGGLCDGRTALCTVFAEPLPRATGAVVQPIASAEFQLRLEPSPIPTTFETDFDPPPSVAPGETITGALKAKNDCSSRFRWTASGCTGIALTWTSESCHFSLPHPALVCDPTPVTCTIVATPEIGQPGIYTWSTVYARDDDPPIAVLSLNGQLRNDWPLQPGEILEVSLWADHSCQNESRHLAVSWDKCNSIVAGLDSIVPRGWNWYLTHPGAALCKGGSVTCSGDVTLGDAAGFQSARVDLKVEVEPWPHPATLTILYPPGHHSGDRLSVGESFTASLSAVNGCGSPFTWLWSCDGIEAPPEGASEVTFAHPGHLCVETPVRCRVEAAPLDGQVSAFAQIEATFEKTPFPEVPLSPLSESSFDPSATPILDCAEDTAITLNPLIEDGFDNRCLYAWGWRQVTALPLELSSTTKRQLTVMAPASRFDQLAGRTAVFEVSVSEAGSPPALQRFDLDLTPRRVIDLALRADRWQAGEGEDISIELTLVNRCAPAFAPLVVVLELDGAMPLQGSATLDGETIGDPEFQDGLWQFQSLTLKKTAPESEVLALRVRRADWGEGTVHAEASVRFGSAPNVVISGATAGTGKAIQRTEGVTFGCSAAGGTAAGWGLVAMTVAWLLRSGRAAPRRTREKPLDTLPRARA